jgi:hypothetical protein
MNQKIGKLSNNFISSSLSRAFGLKTNKFNFTISEKWNNDLNSKESRCGEKEREHEHGHHRHHHHKEGSTVESMNNKPKQENWKTSNEELGGEVLPNINITTDPNSKDTPHKYSPHDHHLNSTRKVYGNMTGMEKIDEYVNLSEKDKENFLKDEATITAGRPSDSSSQYTFRGNLNTDSNPAPKKDVTDEPKKI